jgi:hypothetical protein
MPPPDQLRRTVLPIAAAYGGWLVTGALAVGVLAVWHTALTRLYVALRFDKWGYAAFNDTLWIVFLLAWLVLVVATEHWFRQAADKGLVGRRFARLAVVLLALLGCGVVLRALV